MERNAEARSKIEKVYREVASTNFVERLSPEEIAARYTSEEIGEFISKLRTLKNSLHSLDPHIATSVQETCDKRISILEKALKIAQGTLNITLEARLEGDKHPLGSIVKVRYTVTNLSEIQASVRLECPASRGLKPLSALKDIKLAPKEVYEGTFEFEALKEGEFLVGPIRATARLRDGREVARESEPLRVKIEPEEARLDVYFSAPGEVEEGVPFKVKISLKNSGRIPLEVTVEGINGWSGWRGQLKAGEERVIEASISLSSGVHEVRPIVRYRRPDGQEELARVNGMKVKVLKRTEQLIDTEKLINTVTDHALVFLLGSLTGKILPEKREYSKPVYVQDLPFVKHRGVTYILEGSDGVIVEDQGSIILVRRARPAELKNTISRELARVLMGEFKTFVATRMRGWNPQEINEGWEYIGESHRDLTLEILEDSVKEKVSQESATKELPGCFVLEFKYGRKGRITQQVKLIALVGAYARLKRLLQYGTDHEPLTIDDALRGLRLHEKPNLPGGVHRVFVLASPTGWTPDSIKQVSRIAGSEHYILINLKTWECFYNKNDPISRDLVIHLDLEQPNIPLHNERLEKLDIALLNGDIDEQTYWSKVKEIMSSD